jgi:predicted nucleic-acid-binding Zn-ribbon protein
LQIQENVYCFYLTENCGCTGLYSALYVSIQ